MIKKIFPLLIIFITVLILYYPVFSTYFSQDDFFHFKVSQTDGSLKGFLNLFGFHPFAERGIAFYRPIFREVLFNSFYTIFGLNHLPFRILSLAIHFLNIYLVYIFMQNLFPRKIISFFIAFFFGISSAHVASLYYLAGGIQALGATTFIFLTLIFFLNYLNKRDIKYKFLSFATFFLALGSHELAAILPFLLVGLIILYVPEKAWPIIKLWPFFLVVFIYLYLDITKIGFSSGELQYQLIFNQMTFVNNLAWYSGWALGLPEMLLDFVMPGFKLNPTLMRYWGNYFIIIFATFFISVTILGISLIYLIRKGQIFKKKFYFFLIWFPLGLMPVIFLPSHKSTYYLAPVLPAFWAIVAYLIFHTHLARFLVITFCLAALILSVTSINLGHSTYWAAQRGKLAKKLIDQVITTYPMLPKGSAVYFTNDPNYPFVAQDWGGSSKQASFVLNGADALQLLYKDPTLKVFYEDLGELPEGIPQDRIFTVVAKIY